MRFWQWIAVALCLVSTSCSKTIEYETLWEKRPEFRPVLELKETQPDSAFACFNRIADTLDEAALQRQSQFLYAEYQVLKVEVYYKNYRNAQNDSQVTEACGFYESLFPNQRAMNHNKGLAFQYARACYYQAVAEGRNEDLYIQSFSDFLKSLWIVDGLNGKRHAVRFKSDNAEYEHFTGLIYDRLAWFLYNHDNWDAAMECLDLSNECFANENSLEGIASNYELMGDVMLAQEKLNEAVVYYRQADSINGLLHKDSEYLKFNAMVHNAISLSSAGNLEEAKTLYLRCLQNPSRDWMERRIHLGLGYIYNRLQASDSALYHFERSYPLLPRQNLKSYCFIINLANQLGDSLKASRYGNMLADYNLNQLRHNGQKTRRVSLFENHKADSKDVRRQDLICFVLMLTFVLAVVILIDSLRKRRHKREIERHEQIKVSLENEIETTRRAARCKEEEVKALEAKLQKVINNPGFQDLPFDKKMETLHEMPICKRVCMVKEANVKAGSSYPELVLSDKQMTNLVNALNAVFPKFSVKLMGKYPRMKWSDMVYCCMYVLGVSEVQAAALTGKTYQAVWTRSLKLHEIFDNKSNLQLFLHDFLKDL